MSCVTPRIGAAVVQKFGWQSLSPLPSAQNQVRVPVDPNPAWVFERILNQKFLLLGIRDLVSHGFENLRKF